VARRKVTETTQARRTGIVLVALLAALAGFALVRGRAERAAIWGALSALSLVVVFAAPSLWLSIWRVWMRVAMAISTAITVAILGLCYGLIFAPVGFFMRLAGRDALDASWNRKKDSYWVPREPVEPSLDRYRKQY
jgi:hypothetical protein